MGERMMDYDDLKDLTGRVAQSWDRAAMEKELAQASEQMVRMQEENERLRAALEPFAQWSGQFQGLASDIRVSLVVEPHIVWLEEALPIYAFDNARAALKENET